MSHYAVSRVKIVNPNQQILKRALQRLAEKIGAELLENARVRGWGFNRRVNYLLKMKLPYGNGYGIEITDNGIRIHVDEHGAPMRAEELARELTALYTAEAMREVLQEMGYSASIEEQNDKIVINAGESWGW